MKTTVLLFALLLSSSVFAVQEGPFVSGSLGSQDVDIRGTDVDSAPGFTLATGYAWKHYSFDINYYEASTADVDIDGLPGVSTDVRMSSYYLMNRLHIPFSETFEAFVGIGFGHSEVDLKVKVSGVSVTDDSETGGIYTLGATWYVRPDFGVTADWRQFDLFDEDVDVFAIGFIYSFP